MRTTTRKKNPMKPSPRRRLALAATATALSWAAVLAPAIYLITN